jgi:hypothetical protein
VELLAAEHTDCGLPLVVLDVGDGKEGDWWIVLDDIERQKAKDAAERQQLVQLEVDLATARMRFEQATGRDWHTAQPGEIARYYR